MHILGHIIAFYSTETSSRSESQLAIDLLELWRSSRVWKNSSRFLFISGLTISKTVSSTKVLVSVRRMTVELNRLISLRWICCLNRLISIPLKNALFSAEVWCFSLKLEYMDTWGILWFWLCRFSTSSSTLGSLKQATRIDITMLRTWFNSQFTLFRSWWWSLRVDAGTMSMPMVYHIGGFGLGLFWVISCFMDSWLCSSVLIILTTALSHLVI